MTPEAVKRVKAGIIVFYVLLFAGLAMYDERPDPDMAAEMARPLPSFSGPENAYVFLLGFEAPAGKSPFEAGKDKLREMERAFTRKTSLPAYFSSFDTGLGQTVFKGEIPALYGSGDKEILDFIKAHPHDTAALFRSNGELLRRYKTLLSLREYHEPIDYSYYMPFARFSSVRSLQALYLFEVAEKARRGTVGEALVGLQKDMEFWRMVLHESDTLLPKLFAIGLATRDLLFAAEIGSGKSLGAEELTVLKNTLRSFDIRGAMKTAFRGEARYQYAGMDLAMGQKAGPLDRILVKKNATRNRMYENTREMIRAAELPADVFAEESTLRESDEYVPGKIGIAFLYSPVGETLAHMSRSQAFFSYMKSGHDLEGLRRLALLKVLARREQVRADDMQRFLDAASAELNDPYRNRPMQWDAEKGSIYFMRVAGNKRVEIFL